MIFDDVKSNLFILCPNNSGSTFLQKALHKCKTVAYLPTEGQYVRGFSTLGPDPKTLDCGAMWTINESIFVDTSEYDWQKIKELWDIKKIVSSLSPEVFVEKSPPNLLRANQLVINFPNVKFIILVRNPYALVDGIKRQQPRADNIIAANHVMKCFEYQADNKLIYKDRSIYLRYEDLCNKPAYWSNLISVWMDGLDDLTFLDPIKVKGRYNEPIRDMNREQISHLSSKDIVEINTVFDKSLVEQFGYDLL